MAYTDITFLQSYTRTTYTTLTTPSLADVTAFLALSEAEVTEFSGKNWEVHENIETIYEPRAGLTLLKDRPVVGDITSIVDGDGNVVTYEQRDGDFVKFTSLPSKAIVTYNAGYVNVPAAVQMLTVLYTIRKIKQSESTTAGASNSISLGPISISNSIGTSTIIGL